MPQHNSVHVERFLMAQRSKALVFAKVRLRDEDHALDVLQEAMIGFVSALSKPSGQQYTPECWEPLFYKILIRRMTDFQRKQTWRNRLQKIVPFSQLTSIHDEPDNPEAWENLHHQANRESVSSVESSCLAEDLSAQFEQALEALPARQQEAYILRQWQGKSVKETAEMMGCSVGSVKTHVYRAMQRLRQDLSDWEQDE